VVPGHETALRRALGSRDGVASGRHDVPFHISLSGPAEKPEDELPTTMQSFRAGQDTPRKKCNLGSGLRVSAEPASVTPAAAWPAVQASAAAVMAAAVRAAAVTAVTVPTAWRRLAIGVIFICHTTRLKPAPVTGPRAPQDPAQWTRHPSPRLTGLRGAVDGFAATILARHSGLRDDERPSSQ